MAAPESANAGNPVEKKLRSLKKRMSSIDELMVRQQAGDALNADQLSKIAARVEVEQEMARWATFTDVEELGKECKKLGKKLRQVM